MKEVVLVCGATASGKTRLAHLIAKNAGGEIISADSMKVYKYANIGTSKPPPSFLKEVKYHLMDIITPGERYNVGRFYRDSCALIRKMHHKKTLPVVAGGTALYVAKLMDGLAEIPPVPDGLKSRMERLSTDKLYNKLKDKDPERAAKIHPNMRKRIMRALGVVIHTGRKMSGFLAETKPPPFKFIPLQITWKRERLYNNINYRVDYMLKKGLLDEVKMIYNKWGESAPVFEGVGYKEMLSFIKGGISLPEATERIKKNTRNYARRQLIWWRKRKTVKLEGEKFVEEGVL